MLNKTPQLILPEESMTWGRWAESAINALIKQVSLQEAEIKRLQRTVETLRNQ